jgi:hypothetical protein
VGQAAFKQARIGSWLEDTSRLLLASLTCSKDEVDQPAVRPTRPTV